jgi:hypothetical protein
VTGRQTEAENIRGRIQAGFDALGICGQAWRGHGCEKQLFDAWVLQDKVQVSSLTFQFFGVKTMRSCQPMNQRELPPRLRTLPRDVVQVILSPWFRRQGLPHVLEAEAGGRREYRSVLSSSTRAPGLFLLEAKACTSRPVTNPPAGPDHEFRSSFHNSLT